MGLFNILVSTVNLPFQETNIDNMMITNLDTSVPKLKIYILPKGAYYN